MRKAERHTFQVLTKRSSVMRRYVNERYHALNVPQNVWLGVSVESPRELVRVKHLRQTSAALRFISFEPLLAKIGDVNMAGIEWAIVGGESGPGHRPIDPDWVRELRDQCVSQHVAFFFKQWGEYLPINIPNGSQLTDQYTFQKVGKKRAGRRFLSQEWNELPEIAK